jgi:hypothetical protein
MAGLFIMLLYFITARPGAVFDMGYPLSVFIYGMGTVNLPAAV